MVEVRFVNGETVELDGYVLEYETNNLTLTVVGPEGQNTLYEVINYREE